MRNSRRRNVLREIRRRQRDPFRVRLKPVAAHSRSPDQLLLPTAPAPPKPGSDGPAEPQQIDLEEYLATLPTKGKLP
jgi:hypothetical protein